MLDIKIVNELLTRKSVIDENAGNENCLRVFTGKCRLPRLPGSKGLRGLSWRAGIARPGRAGGSEAFDFFFEPLLFSS